MRGDRCGLTEMIDDMSIDDERLDKAFDELDVINRFLGGEHVSVLGAGRLVQRMPQDHTLTMLDCGAGGSDLCRVLRPLNRNLQVTSLDLNSRACRYTARRSTNSCAVNASALHLPFRDQSFDIVHASLFCHHFGPGELRMLLAEWSRVARVGIVINDLQRSIWAYIGIRLLTGLFSRSVMVRHDGPVSVRRGFLREELIEIVSEFGEAVVSWHWAFRWLVVIHLTSRDNERNDV
jgi:ubiquinone/menaquinone biosynthesis C-methylase UbiE